MSSHHVFMLVLFDVMWFYVFSIDYDQPVACDHYNYLNITTCGPTCTIDKPAIRTKNNNLITSINLKNIQNLN